MSLLFALFYLIVYAFTFLPAVQYVPNKCLMLKFGALVIQQCTEHTKTNTALDSGCI